MARQFRHGRAKAEDLMIAAEASTLAPDPDPIPPADEPLGRLGFAQFDADPPSLAADAPRQLPATPQ